jgi:hypothetical protein
MEVNFEAEPFLHRRATHIPSYQSSILDYNRLKARLAKPIKAAAPPATNGIALPFISPLRILTTQLHTSTESTTIPTHSTRLRSRVASLNKTESDFNKLWARFERAIQRRAPMTKSRTPNSRPTTSDSGARGIPKILEPSWGVSSMLPPAIMRVIEMVWMDAVANVERD